MALAPWKIWDVIVDGWPPMQYTAPTRGKALACALRDYQNYDGHMTFKRWIKMAKARVRKAALPDDGYGYVRRAYGVDPQIGARVTLKNEGRSSGRQGTIVYPNGRSTAHVHVVFDGNDFPLSVHPLNCGLPVKSSEAA